MAEGLADDKGLANRIDIFEQFVALNLYELGGFGAEGRRESVDELVRRTTGSSEKSKPTRA